MWEKGRQDTHTELKVGPGTCVEELVVPGSSTAAGRLFVFYRLAFGPLADITAPGAVRGSFPLELPGLPAAS